MDDSSAWFSFLEFALVVGGLGIPILIGVYRSYKERGFMERTAQALGFTYQERGNASASQAKGLTGGEINDLIAGTHNGIWVAAFTYRVLVGGKNKYWSYMTVLETALPVKLPDIVLRPAKEGFDEGANMAVARNSFLGDYEAVALEGDFGKYFTLYAAKGTHIEALEIFTPDIMAELIDKYQGYGLEFSSDTLYLYPMKLIEDDATFMQALALLEGLAAKLSLTLGAMAASAQEPVASQ